MPGTKDKDISLRLTRVYNSEVYIRQEENVFSQISLGKHPSTVLGPNGEIYSLIEDEVTAILMRMKKLLDDDIRNKKSTTYQEPNPDPMIIKD